MPTFKTVCWGGPLDVEVNNPSITDPIVQDVFVSGQCHAMALAVNAITGWDMYGVYAGYDSVPDHVVCLSPKGYIDVNGIIDECSRFSEGRGYIYKKITRGDIEFWVEEHKRNPKQGYLEPNVKDTMPYAEQVVKLGGFNVAE